MINYTYAYRFENDGGVCLKLYLSLNSVILSTQKDKKKIKIKVALYQVVYFTKLFLFTLHSVVRPVFLCFENLH